MGIEERKIYDGSLNHDVNNDHVALYRTVHQFPILFQWTQETKDIHSIGGRDAKELFKTIP